VPIIGFDNSKWFLHGFQMAEYTLKNARVTALHARWVTEALESGPAKPLKMADLNAAFTRGTKRAAARKAAK